jgi:hypothetical protein
LSLDCCHESSAPRGAVDSDGGGRPSSPGRRSGGVEAGGSRPWGSPGLVGAASTKSGRSRTAGWVGPGEGDGKVYARNRCCYASLGNASSNPVDVGWFAVQTCPDVGRETPGPACSSGPGGHGEGLRRSRGDAAGVEPGASPVDRAIVNVGTTRYRSIALFPAGDEAVDRPDAGRRVRWGGAVVVLRAGESPRAWGRTAACQSRRGCNVRRRAGECRRRAVAGC